APIASNTTSLLRFTNTGTSAGSATVTLYAADTGNELGSWTSAAIPSLASLQVDLSSLIAMATPALTTAQAAAALDLRVRGDFRGTVQNVLVANGIASNVSSCFARGGDRVFGNVAGPFNTFLSSGIRISNPSDAAHTVTLTLHSSADGSTLSTWM